MTKNFGGGGTMEVENINIKRKELKQMMNVIKSKKKILFFTFLSMVVLFGCSNGKEQSVADKLYKDLDAKETYEKAIEYFNENVTYVKYKHSWKQYEEIENEEEAILLGEDISIIERFKENGKYNTISYAYMNSEFPSMSLYILKDGEGSVLLSKDRIFEDVRDLNKEYYENNVFSTIIYLSEDDPLMTSIYGNEDVEVIDITKVEEDDNIVVKMRYVSTVNLGYMGTKEIYYESYIIIGSNGLIFETGSESYTDKTFEKKKGSPSTIRYSNFNGKTTFDYEEEKQKLKDLEGKDIDVIKDMFE